MFATGETAAAFSELYLQIVLYALGQCLPRSTQAQAGLAGSARRRASPVPALQEGFRGQASGQVSSSLWLLLGLATISCWAAKACPPLPEPAALA